jgi:carbon monoxide dehydrogenase subunit G
MSRQIKSDITLIQRPAADIFTFLGDFNNFTPLMPDQVTNWQATFDHCTFEIRGLITMGMRITERIPTQKIVMVGEGKIPFQFSLTAYLTVIGDTSTEVQLVIDSDMNHVIAMMAEKPLAEFVDTLASRLKSEMEKQS